MPGPEVVRRIRGDRPELLTLFMSGYDQNRLAEAGHDPHQLLRKPFTVQELARAVREQIESGAALAGGASAEDVSRSAGG